MRRFVRASPRAAGLTILFAGILLGLARPVRAQASTAPARVGGKEAAAAAPASRKEAAGTVPNGGNAAGPRDSATSVAAAGRAGSTAGKRVIRLEAIKVEGRLQKPQAFYILQRSNLNFESLELKQSFVPKIIKSIERPPF